MAILKPWILKNILGLVLTFLGKGGLIRQIGNSNY